MVIYPVPKQAPVLVSLPLLTSSMPAPRVQSPSDWNFDDISLPLTIEIRQYCTVSSYRFTSHSHSLAALWAKTRAKVADINKVQWKRHLGQIIVMTRLGPGYPVQFRPCTASCGVLFAIYLVSPWANNCNDEADAGLLLFNNYTSRNSWGCISMLQTVSGDSSHCSIQGTMNAM